MTKKMMIVVVLVVVASTPKTKTLKEMTVIQWRIFLTLVVEVAVINCMCMFVCYRKSFFFVSLFFYFFHFQGIFYEFCILFLFFFIFFADAVLVSKFKPYMFVCGYCCYCSSVLDIFAELLLCSCSRFFFLLFGWPQQQEIHTNTCTNVNILASFIISSK